MAPVLLSTPAVVISTRSLGESDLLISLFTLESGKIKAVAKGAKKSKKRFMNALEPFTEIDANLARSRSSGLWRLDSVVIKRSHVSIRQDYSRFLYGCLCLELLELWQKEGAEEPEVFTLLKWYLSRLSGDSLPIQVSLVFKARLLKSAGLMPGIKECRVCGCIPDRGPVSFDRRTGEIFCSSCGKNAASAAEISLGTARCIEFMVNSSLDRVQLLKPRPDQVTEAWEYMKLLHCRHLQRQPASYRLIPHNMYMGRYK